MNLTRTISIPHAQEREVQKPAIQEASDKFVPLDFENII